MPAGFSPIQRPQFNPNNYNYGTGVPLLRWTAFAMISIQIVKSGLYVYTANLGELLGKVANITIKLMVVIGGIALITGSLRGYYGAEFIDPFVIKGAQCAIAGIELVSIPIILAQIGQFLQNS